MRLWLLDRRQVFSGDNMPLYMDVHNLQGASTIQIDQAHSADLAEQGKYGVKYLKYWFDEGKGKAFCLVDAPSPDAAQSVHRQAHGQLAEKIIEVQPDLIDAFLGGGETSPSGAVLRPGSAGAERDPAIRTILFTDIVGSTDRAARIGDRAWGEVKRRHHDIVRLEIDRFRGHERDTAGDGFFATFDGPARAVRCAKAIEERVGSIALAIRAGVHTGEVEITPEGPSGISVHFGARVAALARSNEVWASSTVRDLTAGSGLVFEDVGEHQLKGVPDPWRLYRVS